MLFGTASAIDQQKKKQFSSVPIVAHIVDPKKKNITDSDGENRNQQKQQQKP